MSKVYVRNNSFKDIVQSEFSLALTVCVSINSLTTGGWLGGAMVLGKLPVPGRPTIWITVGQGPTALAVGAGGGCLDIFTLIYPFSPLSPSLWETARYRLKYCLKGPLNPKQPTNQPTLTTEKQTTKFSSANFQKMLSPSYIILRIQRLEGKQCRSR